MDLFFLWLKGFILIFEVIKHEVWNQTSIAQILYTVNNSVNVFFLQFPALNQVPQHLHGLSHFQKKIFLAMWLMKKEENIGRDCRKGIKIIVPSTTTVFN